MAKSRHKRYSAGGRIRHFVASEPTRLLMVLTDHLKLSPEKSHELLALGAVYCNKWRVREDRDLEKGAYVRVHIEPKRYPLPKLKWRDLVVGEGRDFLVVNKPPGVPMHAMLDNEVENLLYQLRAAGYPELWVTQRLDNDTQGICVLAKTKAFQRSFNEILRKRELEKNYRAWVKGKPATGPLTHYMRPTPWAPKEVGLEPQSGWARCDLVIEKSAPVAGAKDISEIEIRLITGRTHQIRVQLAAMGSPVLGDCLYGGDPAPFLALQAFRLKFYAGGEREFEIPPPAEWRSGA